MRGRVGRSHAEASETRDRIVQLDRSRRLDVGYAGLGSQMKRIEAASVLARACRCLWRTEDCVEVAETDRNAQFVCETKVWA